MEHRLSSRLLLIVLLLLGTVALPLHAEGTPPSSADMRALGRQLDTYDRDLKRRGPADIDFKEWLQQLTTIKQTASECVTTTQAAVTKRKGDLATLGPPVANESSDVSRQRDALKREMAESEKTLASCRLLLLRSDDLLNKATAAQQEYLTNKLLARGASLPALVNDHWDDVPHWIAGSVTFIVRNSGMEVLSPGEWVGLGFVAAVLFAIGMGLRERLRRIAQHRPEDRTFSHLFLRAAAAVYGRYLPHIIVTSGGALFFYLASDHITLMSMVIYGLVPYFLLLSTIQLFLAPCAPAEPFLPVPEPVARALSRRLKLLSLLMFIGFLLFAVLLAQDLPRSAILLARGIYASIFIVNLVWAIWLVGRIPKLASTFALRGVLVLVFIADLVAEWLGYRNVSTYVFRAVVGTVIAIGLFTLLQRLLRELFDGLDTGRQGWQRSIRRFIGLKPYDRMPGLGWLRSLVYLALWLGFGATALYIWGLSETGFHQIYVFVGEGFTVGSLRIVPARIVLALFSFLLLFTLSGWFKRRLERHWLVDARMDRGARETMVTISGYLGVAVAMLVALSIAGMRFDNLAIIAGALSVGIGFGLQNIVNNFVSGLILLFERPIKTGDWVVVGSTEGYVKRISIRSTQIQTFDRADVIVPNSDLISGQVINWMLHDPRGRVRVPVGVAYGSDTELVKNILLRIAAEHPLVLNDGPYSMHTVLFIGFGDSSLNFELRCFIQNIDQRLQVISDINFAIDREFRAHNIEIPFPQRDLHVRNWPPEAPGGGSQ